MTSLSAARAAMRDLHRAPEPEVLARLLPAATLDAATRARVEGRALGLLADLRAAQGSGWVNRFLQQYRLNTAEGIALLSLAEAFLRVPDAATADLLIRDKIGGADWGAHAGKSDSALVNSATWGLVLTRAVVGESGSVLRRLIARSGEPFVRTAVGAAMRMMGQIFVMGRTIDEALERAADKDNAGFTASFDMLGEAARTRDDAARYYDSYVAAIARIGAANIVHGHSISVKLSALHPRYETAHAATCVPELTDRLGSLASAAAKAGIGLTVDAEESERLDMSLDIIAAVAAHRQLAGWDGFGMAVQAYSKRSRAVLDWAQALGADTGRRLGVRLVKGAYWDSEIKRTQVEGLSDYPLFTRKAATDVSYLACAAQMLGSPNLFPAFATHNALTVATILDWAGPDRSRFEFQRLHGMGEGLYERLVREEGYACRSYAPVGGHRDLLAYLVRRLLENGANSSFVHQLADTNVDDAALLADPAVRIAAVGGSRHPSIPLPRDLFPGRVNSAGLDLADAGVLADVSRDVLLFDEADPLSNKRAGVKDADGHYGDVAAAVAAAHAAFPAWDATPVDRRAAILERLADLLERDRAKLMALCVDEGRKTIPDALGEVREAVDFCRYYAAQARDQFVPLVLPGPTGERNELHLAGRGVFACIAPWNFPLAIFLGQVAAALAAGNAVVAKPAPQTPRIAAAAVALAHEAGVPADVLRLVTGGAAEGEALVGDPRVMGVAFTGSTATARAIARTLLVDDRRPLVPLIAETGGLNAMLVELDRAPRTGRRRRRHLGVPLGRAAVLGAAPAAGSGGCRRPCAGDAQGGDGHARRRRPGRSADRRRPGDRRRGVRPAGDVPPGDARPLGPHRGRAGDGRVRRADGHPPRPAGGSDRRVVRAAPPRRDVAGGRAGGDGRRGQRQRLRPDDGAPQPDRGVGDDRRGDGAGRQPLRQPGDDRRRRRQPAVRRRGPVGDRAQSGRTALPRPLRRRADGVDRHDERRRQRDPAQPRRRRNLSRGRNFGADASLRRRRRRR